MGDTAGAPTAEARTSRPWLLLALLAVALPHLPVLGLGWVNGDDLGHAAAAARILGGDWAVARDVLVQDNLLASMRPVPYLVWMAEDLLLGTAAGPRYALNLGLHLALVAAFFALLLKLRGARAAPWAAAIAVCAGLHLATAQGPRWLAARDDQLAALFGTLAMLSWPRAEGDPPRRGAAMLCYLLAVLSKPSALLLPLLLPAWTGTRGLAASLQLLRPFVGFATLWLVVLLSTVRWDEMLTEARPELAWDVVLARPAELLFALLALPHGSVEPGPRSLGADVARAASTLPFVLLGAWRGLDRRVVTFGLLWALSQCLVPLPMWISADFSLRDSGRYLLLPSLGLWIAVFGAVPLASSIRHGFAAGWIVATAGAFSIAASPVLAVERSGADALLRVFDAAHEDAESGLLTELWVGLSRVDAGVLAVLSDPVIRTFYPSLRGRVAVFLQGQEGAHTPSIVEGLHYGDPPTLPRAVGLHLDGAGPGRIVVIDRFERRAPAEAPIHRYVRTGLVHRRATGAPRVHWAFEGGAEGWSGTGLPLPRFDARAGFRLESARKLDLHALTRELQVPAARTPAFFSSPPLDLDPRAYCEAVLRFDLPEPSADRTDADLGDSALVGTGRFGAFLWSADPAFADPWSSFVLLPLPTRGGLHQARVRLDHAPAWDLAPRVAAVGVLPSNEPGVQRLLAVSLEPCAPAP